MALQVAGIQECLQKGKRSLARVHAGKALSNDAKRFMTDISATEFQSGDQVTASNSSGTDEALLLSVIRQVIAELRGGSVPPRITTSSKFAEDLGIESISRMELLQRIEEAFNVRLSDHVMMNAASPRDLLPHLVPQVPVGPGQKAVSGSEATVLAQGSSRSHPLLRDTANVEFLPNDARTLVEVLEHHAQHNGDLAHVRLFEDEVGETLTYRELYNRAKAVAAGLFRYGVNPGDRIAMVLPTGVDFLTSFLGIMIAGCVPVPLYPPHRMSAIEEHARRQIRILSDCNAKIVISVPEGKNLGRLLRASLPNLSDVLTAEDLAAASSNSLFPRVGEESIAFLQYTSGSTGQPKGVILTHTNLLANIREIGDRLDVRRSDVCVSWLPLYHDMGLIGAWLGSLYFGIPLILMSPLSFLARPERWLRAISSFGGTISAAPNFAYQLCAQRINEKALAGIRLDSWRIALNGAEPVVPETYRAFIRRFEPLGFDARAMTPVYGLAESCLAVTIPTPHAETRIDRICRDTFQNTGRAVPASSTEESALEFVSCGSPLKNHELRIIDEAGFEVPDRVEGKIQFRGPSASSGYFQNPTATRELISGRWLNSGDRGYLADADLFVTGRVKDIIIVGGRNLYPHEIENELNSVEGIRKGAVAAFASRGATSGTDRLVVIAESHAKNASERDEIARRAREALLSSLGVSPDELVVVPPRTVLKTSSGKIRRAACREMFERGSLKSQPSTFEQCTRLVLTALVPALRRKLRSVRAVLFGIYCWFFLLTLGIFTWCGVMLLPSVKSRRNLIKFSCRTLFKVCGIKFVVDDLGSVPTSGPALVISNHASYLDALVLSAALPLNYSFVAKRELTLNSFLRVFLERIDTKFVERSDAQRGFDDVEAVTKSLAQGAALVFFPEGTFLRSPGLLPFRMGAFHAAVSAKLPVIPIAISGTRNVLRSDQWMPRCGEIAVKSEEALFPRGEGWKAIIDLRDRARGVIQKMSGEPVLSVVEDFRDSELSEKSDETDSLQQQPLPSR